MIFPRQIRYAAQLLYGLLLVSWPLLDTGSTGAITSLRIGLAATTTLLLAAASLPTAHNGQPVRLHLVDGGTVLCAGWFILHSFVISPGEIDPYPLLNGWILLTAYGYCRMVGTDLLLPATLASGLVQSGIALAQSAGRIATRHTYYDLTGSFPNPGPLGGWLCIAALAAVLLTLRAWKHGRKIRSAGYAIAGVCIGIVLWLSDSRAAWVGFAAGIFGLLGRAKFRHKRLMLLTAAIVGSIGISSLYLYKKQSADGRLLVWRVSADLIAQKPIAGQGIGTFPEHYMFAQADYFARHPDSPFVAVADQVSHPFNELIGTVCEQGIIGGLLSLLVIGAALTCHGETDSKILLVGLLLFGMFSYPSAFLVFGLLFAALLAGCANASHPSGRRLSGRTASGIGAAALIGGAVLLPGLYQAGATLRNRNTLLQEVSGAMRRDTEVDPSELPRLERLAERLPIAELYTDLGDRWLETGRIERAKNNYRLAARMIPSRLRPYDGLFRAYRRAGQLDSATIMARHILTLPVKIGNTTTIRIRQSARTWLNDRSTLPVAPDGT